MNALGFGMELGWSGVRGGNGVGSDIPRSCCYFLYEEVDSKVAKPMSSPDNFLSSREPNVPVGSLKRKSWVDYMRSFPAVARWFGITQNILARQYTSQASFFCILL